LVGKAKNEHKVREREREREGERRTPFVWDFAPLLLFPIEQFFELFICSTSQ